MQFNIDKYYLRSTSLFDFLSEEEKSYVKSHMLRKEYMKGEMIFEEDSYSRGVFIIKKGKVKIFQTDSQGRKSIVYIYKRGDYFGYRPLLGDQPHPASAQAVDSVVVSFIPGSIFQKLLASSTPFARKLLTNLSQEFSVWINKMTVFSQYSIKERTAISLLILRKIYQKEDDPPYSVTISLNRDDFAGFVGTTKETLVRMLRVFKDEKIIETKGTKITILKPKALNAFIPV